MQAGHRGVERLDDGLDHGGEIDLEIHAAHPHERDERGDRGHLLRRRLRRRLRLRLRRRLRLRLRLGLGLRLRLRLGLRLGLRP